MTVGEEFPPPPPPPPPLQERRVRLSKTPIIRIACFLNAFISKRSLSLIIFFKSKPTLKFL
jgi:hypothetical protein